MSSPSLHKCGICDGPTKPNYQMNDYQLQRCMSCGTIGVLKPPSESELAEYYDGFKFLVNIKNYQRVRTDAVHKWMTDLLGTGSSKTMLDVGGGGGFFARAFEEFGLGTSTYIDLDPEACEFAKSDMQLTNVICDRVENLGRHLANKQSFDFVYCRHVIEHLINPKPLIRHCAELLKPDGVFVLQCPNGMSKEGLLFPRYWMKFVRPLQASNGWNLMRSIRFSCSRNFGWGIDPVRHLWALSEAGIRSVFEDSSEFQIEFQTRLSPTRFTHPIGNPMDSWSEFQRSQAAFFVTPLSTACTWWRLFVARID